MLKMVRGGSSIENVSTTEQSVFCQEKSQLIPSVLRIFKQACLKIKLTIK